MKYILFMSIFISFACLVDAICKYLKILGKEKTEISEIRKCEFIHKKIENCILIYINSYTSDPRFPKDVTIKIAHNNILNMVLGTISKEDKEYMCKHNKMFENMVSLIILEHLGNAIQMKKEPSNLNYVIHIEDLDDAEANDE